MAWERVVGANPNGHRCPTPRYEEWWEEKKAEEGSQWRCDECNVLWTLVSTGDMNGFGSSCWKPDDEYALEIEDSYRAASDRIFKDYGHVETPMEIFAEVGRGETTKGKWKKILG